MRGDVGVRVAGYLGGIEDSNRGVRWVSSGSFLREKQLSLWNQFWPLCPKIFCAYSLPKEHRTMVFFASQDVGFGKFPC